MALILPVLGAAVLLLNATTYLFYWVDKSQAEQGGYRISESKLLLLAAIGGSPAAIFACHVLRHKTRKQSFRTVLYLIFAAQAVFLAFYLFHLSPA
jgi:uncharacterized membrane protein YsdA (DUF1294 family)